MSLPTDIQQWVEASDYDLGTAEAMLSAGRYLYVLFCCQQATEKMLKGVVVKRTGEFPPKTHNFSRLLELAALKIDKETEEFLGRLSFYYLEARYPTELGKLSRMVSRDMARQYLAKAKELLVWLKQELIR